MCGLESRWFFTLSFLDGEKKYFRNLTLRSKFFDVPRTNLAGSGSSVFLSHLFYLYSPLFLLPALRTLRQQHFPVQPWETEQQMQRRKSTIGYLDVTFLVSLLQEFAWPSNWQMVTRGSKARICNSQCTFFLKVYRHFRLKVKDTFCHTVLYRLHFRLSTGPIVSVSIFYSVPEP